MNSFMKGLLVGAGIGLLIAPMRGEQLRQLMAQRFEELRSNLPENEQLNQYTQQVTSRVSQTADNLKNLAQQAANTVQSASSQLGNIGQQAASQAANTVQSAGNQLGNIGQKAASNVKNTSQDVASTTKQAVSQTPNNPTQPGPTTGTGTAGTGA
jgi:gas vesicle protein